MMLNSKPKSKYQIKIKKVRRLIFKIAKKGLNIYI